MFLGLLADLDSAIKQAKSTQRSFKSTVDSAKGIMGVSDEEALDYNVRLKSGPITSFGKADRFKELEKQQLNHTATSFNTSESLYESETKSKPGAIFGRSSRFNESRDKELMKKQTLLYPNLNAVKKTPANVVITPCPERDRNRLGKSTMTNSTMDDSRTISDLGPGAYFDSTNNPDLSKTPAFPKAERFRSPSAAAAVADTPLYPNIDSVKRRPPTTATLKPNIPKNPKQILKKQQQQIRDRVKMLYWLSVPLEIDRLIKSNVGGPKLKEDYFNIQRLNPRAKRCAMQMFIDRLNYLRGGFTYNLEKKEKQVCMVVYRLSTPKPFKLPDRLPSSAEYYPKDDYIKPKNMGFTFAQYGKTPAPVPEDKRDYQVNQELTKKRIVGGVVAPESVYEHRLTEEELASLRRGPGFYDAVFSQVQKRDDIGVVKIPEITKQNDRVNNIHKKIDKDLAELDGGMYFPQYTAIDKNIPGPLYKEPTVVETAHLPEKYVFPEHWVFYDGDLNKVRAQVAKNVLFGGGLDFDQYQQFTKKMNSFKEYLQRQRKAPQVGEYDVKYDVIDPEEGNFVNYNKMQERGLIDPIVKEEGDVDGDNLMLNPDKPKPKLPDINFGKMVGRSDNQDTDSDVPKPGDVLLIDPKLPEKKLPDIKFDKMIGRPEQEQRADDFDGGREGDRLVLEPKLPEPHIPTVNVEKGLPRQDPVPQRDEEAEEIKLDVNYGQVQKKVKGFVDMQRHSQVRVVPVLRKQGDPTKPTSTNIRMKRLSKAKTEMSKVSSKQGQQKEQS